MARVTAQQYACGIRHGGHRFRFDQKKRRCVSVSPHGGRRFADFARFRCPLCYLQYEARWDNLCQYEKDLVTLSMQKQGD